VPRGGAGCIAMVTSALGSRATCHSLHAPSANSLVPMSLNNTKKTDRQTKQTFKKAYFYLTLLIIIDFGFHVLIPILRFVLGVLISLLVKT